MGRGTIARSTRSHRMVTATLPASHRVSHKVAFSRVLKEASCFHACAALKALHATSACWHPNVVRGLH